MDNRAARAVHQPKPIAVMKATKLLIAAAAFASLASLSLAGPGPDYWIRMAAAKKSVAKPAVSTAEAAAPAVAATCCTACQGCEVKKS
jgi:hypothetical protein